MLPFVAPRQKLPPMSLLLVRPTSEQIDEARTLEDEQRRRTLEVYGKEHLNNSISEGEGVLIGLLGEIVVRDRYPGVFLRPDVWHPDYDLLAVPGAVPAGSVFEKADVKTKEVTSVPRPHYWATVCDANTHQRCTTYIFARVLSDLSRAWILGYMSKNDFFSDGVAWFEKGAIDPYSDTDTAWTFRWDCWNRHIAELRHMPQQSTDFQLLR
jgi:hypothetical protein